MADQESSADSPDLLDSGMISSEFLGWKMSILDMASNHRAEVASLMKQHQKTLEAAIHNCPSSIHHRRVESVADRDSVIRKKPKDSTGSNSPEIRTPRVRTSAFGKSATCRLCHGKGCSECIEEQLELPEVQPPSPGWRAWVEPIVGAMILLNTITMIANCEVKGWQLSANFVLRKGEGGLENIDYWFDFLEYFFTTFFLAELFLQLVIKGKQYLRDWFNWLDTFVVVTNCVDLYVLQYLAASSLGMNVTILRLTRTVKLARSLRIVRTVRMFHGLRVLVNSFISSLMSLFWSMALLGMIMTIYGLVMASLLEDFIGDDDNNYEVRLYCWNHYGTFTRAFYTMFEITLSGCWPSYARPLIANVGASYTIVFMIYVTFVVFACIRVITAVFLKSTLDTASNDESVMIAEASNKRNGYLKKLKRIFEQADRFGEGEVSSAEFKRLLRDPLVMSYMEKMDLEIHESDQLVELIDNGDGTITYEEFIVGVSRLKGAARTLDIVAIQLDLKKVLHAVTTLGCGPNLVGSGDGPNRGTDLFV